MKIPKSFLLSILALAASTYVLHAEDETNSPTNLPSLPAGVTRVPVAFSGGHATDPRDGGRPIVLIAAALGVSSDVFRDAFSHVHPADPNVGPTPDEAQKNKAALMSALGKYGITNDRLDKVSNYYRYNRGRGELWRVKPATANALVKNGAIIGYELVDGGSGYSSTPTITVPNFKSPSPKITLAYGTTMESNGAISAISLPSQSN
jgi:hypothetical protein